MAKNNLKFTISAVDRTKQAFSLVKRGLGGLSKAVFNFKTALAGAIGIGGLGLLVKNSLEATDRIGKLSNVLGISTKDLQAFKLASEIGGIEFETFARGVRRFTDNIGDFKIGIGEAAVSLQQLGITQAEVLALENDQVGLLGLVADRLNEVEAGAIKTKLAIEIFGGRGAELINVLDGGSEQLRKFAEESVRFGSLTSNQVSAVEGFNDSIVRLKTVFFNLVNLVVANLSPALQKLSDNLRENLLEGFDEAGGGAAAFAKRLSNSILDAVSVTIAGLSDFGNATINLFNKLIRVFNALPFTGDDVAPITFKFDFNKLQTEINTLRKIIEGLGDTTNSVFTELGDKKIPEVTDKINFLEDRFKRLRDTSKQFGDTISQGFERAVFEGQRLTDTLRAIGQEVIKIAFRKSITEPAGEKIGGIFKDVFGSILGGITGKASGGPVSGGQTYVVGERGPEIFRPRSSGTIIPNHALGSASIQVVQNINVMPSVTDTVRAEIFNALPLIREQSISAIIEARSRGGITTKALGLKT